MVDIKEFNFLMAEPRYEKQMKELWAQCFPEDAHGFVDFYFANCYRRKSAYLAVRQGQVCAMLYAPLMKYRMWGVDFTVPYIQGVATAPEYRNLGLANALLRYALKHLHNLGAPFGILKPFRVDFYEKSGWRVFAGLAEVRCGNLAEFMAKSHADAYNKENAAAEKVRCRRLTDINEIADVDLPGLTTIFENWQQAHRNNYPLRSAHDWRLLLTDHFNDGGSLWLAEHEGKSLAYALLNCGDTAEDEIFIRELAAVGRISLKILLEELRQNLPPRPLRLHLPANQRLVEDFITVPFAMVRVINAETLLSAPCLGLPVDEERIFRINDGIIDNNDGIFALSGHDNGSYCHKVDENTHFSKKIPEIDVNLLTGLLFKWYNDNIEVENKEKFFTRLQNEIDGSYFNEYFY